jgi:cyclin B
MVVVANQSCAFVSLQFLRSGEMQMENMVFFFAELALMQYDLVTRLPSLVAASAVYAARLTLKRAAPLWTDTLKHHTGFRESEAELM